MQTMSIVFSEELSPTFLNTGTTDKTLRQYGKQDSFRQIFQSFASIYEISDSKLFRPTVGIHSGTEVFDESSFITNVILILRVTEILYSYRLVLEGKKVKETPESSRLEFLEKFSANSFPLLDSADSTSGPLNR